MLKTTNRPDQNFDRGQSFSILTFTAAYQLQVKITRTLNTESIQLYQPAVEIAVSQQMCFACVDLCLDLWIRFRQRLDSKLSAPFDTLDKHDEGIIGRAECTQKPSQTRV